MVEAEGDLRELREQAERSLYVFCKAILGFDRFDPKVHGPICRLLESGDRRVKIVIPRGWYKTTLCTIGYPAWRAVKDQNVRVLLALNTYSNAAKKLGVIRDVFEKNVLLRAVWPEVMPGSPWKTDSLCLVRGRHLAESTFECAGVRTQVTSRHYDIIIEDDTVAPDFDELGEENVSPTKEDIENAIGWHRLITPLFDDPASSQSIVVGTRWFEKDLLSWMGENEPGYTTYTRAALEDGEGRPDPTGSPAFPSRFPREVLEEIEQRMGPYLYRCLYLNMPTHSRDMIFQPEWLHFYEEAPKDLAVFTTVDLASDPSEVSTSDPDYNVVLTAGKHLGTGEIYVLDYFRERCNPGELIDAVMRHVRAYRPLKVGVENVAYQNTMNYWLRERQRQEGVFFMLEPLRVAKTSKEARITGLQPVFASGSIYLRKWMSVLQSELLAFPLGAHDDVADALALQQTLWFATRTRREMRDRVYGKDPLSLSSALDEFDERKKRGRGFLEDLIVPRESQDPTEVVGWYRN